MGVYKGTRRYEPTSARIRGAATRLKTDQQLAYFWKA
jgi:hypothetical protein